MKIQNINLIFSSHRKSFKIHKKVAKIQEKSDILFLITYLPPLSYFVPTLLDPPSPPKIGHHLCTFPNMWMTSSLQEEPARILSLGIDIFDLKDGEKWPVV